MSVVGLIRLHSLSTSRRSTAGAFFLALALIGCSSDTKPPVAPKDLGSFTLTAEGAAASVRAGDSLRIRVAATRIGGFTGVIALTTSSLPSGVSAVFSPNTLTVGVLESVLLIRADSNATLGRAVVSVTGSSNGVAAQTSTSSFDVVAPPAIALDAPTTLSAGAGRTVRTTLSVVRSGGFVGPVTLTLPDSLQGIRMTLSPAVISSDSTASTLTLVIDSSATPRVASLRVLASAVGVAPKTRTVVLSVPGFTLGFVTTSSVRQADSVTLTATITRVAGFRDAVDLRFDGIPTGVTVSPGTPRINETATSQTVKFVATRQAAVGAYSVRARATAVGEPDRTALLALSISEATPTLVYPSANQFVLCAFTDIPGQGNNGLLHQPCVLKTFEDYGFPALTSFRVTRRDISNFNIAARREELRALPKVTVQRACVWPAQFTFLDAVTRNYVRTNEQTTLYAADDLVLEYSTRWMALRDTAAASLTIQKLVQFSRSEALLGINLTDGNDSFDAKVFAQIALQAYMMLSDYPAARNDRVEIEGYLGKLLPFLDYNVAALLGESQPNGIELNNHGWLRDADQMLWGVYTGDDRRFQLGLRRIASVLAGHVRPDGSIYQESVRGSVALHYSALSIGTLIFMAEVAAQQGYDVYNWKVNGMDLHKMVEHFVSSMEDPGNMTKYARMQLYCTPAQCAAWATQDLSTVSLAGYDHGAWAEYYIRRFPNAALSQRLLAIYPPARLNLVFHGHSGGNTTCQARRLN